MKQFYGRRNSSSFPIRASFLGPAVRPLVRKFDRWHFQDAIDRYLVAPQEALTLWTWHQRRRRRRAIARHSGYSRRRQAMKHPSITLLLAMAGVLALVTAPAVHAECSVAGMTLDGALSAKIGVFDAFGKFLEEVPSEQLAVGQALRACDESLGLVKASLLSGEERWLEAE